MTVTARAQDNRYIVQVRDEGRGMNEDQIRSIGAYMQFDRRFYEQQGSGLGLVIARRLVELYEGTLVIESAPNQGTTITFNLPVRAS